jgi:hypothetical protein
LNQVANLAYIPGEFDKIERLLIDSLGYTATMIHTNDFQNVGLIAQYDAIFINCANSISLNMNPFYDQTLATYVANGGSLYTSDWAVKCLIGEVTSLPCPIERTGGFIADSLLCTRRTGQITTISNALITSPSLQAYLNKTQMIVGYDLSIWEQVKSHNANFWEVMVTDPNNTPLLLRTNLYSNNTRGTVHIGTNSNNEWITICHKPAGSTPVTITINTNALAAHLAHGDAIGECGNEDESGRIYFTTFHNEFNGHVSPDVINILQYMILNL